MRAFCERFAGVDLTDVITESEALRDSVKSAHWLNFLGDDLLGLDDTASERLRAHETARSTQFGVLLQACPIPVVGDRYSQEDMSSYRTVGRLLSPWLVDTLWPMPGFPDDSAVREWLHRLR